MCIRDSLFKDGSDPYFYPNVNWRDLTFKNTAEEAHAYVSVYGLSLIHI